MDLSEFSKKRILVVGDIMLDKHIYGTISRLSPEAPVPILKVEKESYNSGGAANLANNLVSLGAEVYLAGVVGEDEAQQILFNELDKNNINYSCIIKTKKPTIQKIRGLARQHKLYHQHILRIDYEDTSRISREDEEKLLSLIKQKINDIDAIAMCDYAKGTLTESLVKLLISLAKQNNKLITADCKPINVDFYKNVDLLKPNKKEAIEMTLTENIEEAGKRLMEKLNSNVVITKGAEGFSIFEKNKNILHIPSNVKEVYDVSGAGDTVMAVLTIALLSNYNLKEAVELADRAAGIVIGKPGVETVSKEELEDSLNSNIKIVPKEWGQEEWIVNNEKYCGKKMLIKEGYYCSYHMHKIKEETFYILDGEIELIHNGEYLKIGKGETMHLKPGEYHSFRALKDTIFFEFSTQHLDEDNYRLTKSSNGSHEEWKREIEVAIKNE